MDMAERIKNMFKELGKKDEITLSGESSDTQFDGIVTVKRPRRKRCEQFALVAKLDESNGAIAILQCRSL